MITPDVFNHLRACGASGDDIALFQRLIANETLQPVSALPLFERLNEALIEIPGRAYNRVSMHASVRLPIHDYYDRFHQLTSQLMDFDEVAFIALAEQLKESIERFSAQPGELSATRLYKAFDFDAALSAHHAVEDYGSAIFLRTLRRYQVSSPIFHVFALFICFTSTNPHVIQNLLFALLVTNGPVPAALLNVLGRYEPYNLPSFALIGRVPDLTEVERQRLILTHLKSMDDAFYGNKLDVIEMSGDADMNAWAALNVSSASSARYFCDVLIHEDASQDQFLAALDHYGWALTGLEAIGRGQLGEDEAFLWSVVERTQAYIIETVGAILLEGEVFLRLRERYGQFASLNEACGHTDALARTPKTIESVLDAVTQAAAQSRFDAFVAAHAPDLPDQRNGYSSLVRPAGHRYDFFIQVKIAASDRWFPRELARAEDGDLANWGTLTLLLTNGVQFNSLSAWLLKELKNAALPKVTLDALVHDALLHYPASSALWLHARHLFSKALTSHDGKLVRRAISALHRHRSQGHDVPGELHPALQAVNREDLKKLYQRMLEELLTLQ